MTTTYGSGFVFAGVALLLLSSVAQAGGPGPATRQTLLPLGTCEVDPEQLCVDAFDCDGGACTTDLSDVAIRGVLTLIADKDSVHPDSQDPQIEVPVPLTEDAAGNTVPADFRGTTLTLMLEFTRNGENVVIAEAYRDLGPSTIDELNIQCEGFCFPTWREPAVESRIAVVSKGGAGGGGPGDGSGGGSQGQNAGVRILWATLPEPANTALLEALGLPENAVPFLETVGEKDVFDRSGEDDLLATVHRFKVTIRSAFLPAP